MQTKPTYTADLALMQAADGDDGDEPRITDACQRGRACAEVYRRLAGGGDAMTPDQLRRSIRLELHSERCRINNHSEERLWLDAQTLDRRLKEARAFQYETTWGTAPDWIKCTQSPQQADFCLRKSTNAPSDDSECQPDDSEVV
jgi:hypothetical protein